MSDTNKPIHEQTDEELRAQGLPEDFIHYRKFPGYNGYAPPAIMTAVQQEKVEPINTQDPLYANRDDEAVQRVMLMDQIISINPVPENAGPVSIPMTRYTRPLGVDPAVEKPDVTAVTPLPWDLSFDRFQSDARGGTITVTTPSGIPVLLEDGIPFTIEDTREGWTKAMEEVLRRNYVHPVLDRPKAEGDDPAENPCAGMIDFNDIRPKGKSIITVDTPEGPKVLGRRNRLMGRKDIAAMMERLGECVIPRTSHRPADGSEKKPDDADPFGMTALKEEQLKQFPSELSKYLSEMPPTRREVLVGMGVPLLEEPPAVAPVEEEPTPLIVDTKKNTIQ